MTLTWVVSSDFFLAVQGMHVFTAAQTPADLGAPEATKSHSP